MIPSRSVFHFLSHNKVVILIFHRVLRTPDPIFPNELDANRFNQIMVWIKSWFNVVSLDAAVKAIKEKNIPRRTAVITFDDGYADNHDVALPILKKHGLPATFFIATGFLDGGRMWNDTIIESVRHCQEQYLDLSILKLGCHKISTPDQKRAAIEALILNIKYLPTTERDDITECVSKISKMPDVKDLMMTSAQIQALDSAGMQIGAHTVSHPILARTELNNAYIEIGESKNKLEKLLGHKIETFAYPNGKPGIDYLPEHPTLAKELGFSAAVSTTPGVASLSSDLFQLPRFTPWQRKKFNFFAQMTQKYIKN